ncbi:DUF1801 domain-containing protein [Saccharomonospora xinjiangensis]|uniref:YdhG-like domain-containing protein n=1 Tax=Saccharomonospora xinjiangensis XJ-54 TaxID=882086 RepID=I0V8U0_9PSEU|nr:DUF1801 domain-containing protein [Saccharomonospora xinjiangensis]EID56543.1 protein of unknown function (DU1801) [Saccharomonospora xinjiangensis XJ-54]
MTTLTTTSSPATTAGSVASLAPPLRRVAEPLCSLIDEALPEATSALWHGHPTWSLGDKPGRRPVCLVKAHSATVTFGLWRGRQVTDEPGRLRAGARMMASVKLAGVSEIARALFTDWRRQAYSLEEK